MDRPIKFKWAGPTKGPQDFAGHNRPAQVKAHKIFVCHNGPAQVKAHKILADHNGLAQLKAHEILRTIMGYFTTHWIIDPQKQAYI